MEEEFTQIFLKSRTVEKSEIEELEQKLELLCDSKPALYQGKCLLLHPQNIDVKNFLTRGILIFLDTE